MPWVWSEVNIPAWRSTLDKLAIAVQTAGMHLNASEGSLRGRPTLRAAVDEPAMWGQRSRGLLAVLQL